MSPVQPPVKRQYDRSKRREAAARTREARVDPGEAADIVWATNAPELYQLLVYQRGWTPERYEHFLADAWRRLLLAE